MKTTIDAVNELRADISNVAYIKSDETYHCNLNYNDDSGWWCSRGFYGDFVCTIDDFTKKASQQAKPELINGKVYQFDYHSGKNVHGIYHKPNEDGFAIFKFARGAINKELVTNIQLLIVGDK
jgi:hypothetical protein